MFQKILPILLDITASKGMDSAVRRYCRRGHVEEVKELEKN